MNLYVAECSSIRPFLRITVLLSEMKYFPALSSVVYFFTYLGGKGGRTLCAVPWPVAGS